MPVIAAVAQVPMVASPEFGQPPAYLRQQLGGGYPGIAPSHAHLVRAMPIPMHLVGPQPGGAPMHIGIGDLYERCDGYERSGGVERGGGSGGGGGAASTGGKPDSAAGASAAEKEKETDNSNSAHLLAALKVGRGGRSVGG
eukprot:365097-Chlamydomonas_euryale.AAC.1